MSPITITDESKYQPIADLEVRLRDEGLAGCILNVEDPSFRDKAHLILGYGRRLGGYKWIYPNQPGSVQGGRAVDLLVGAGLDPNRDVTAGLWADHEDGPPDDSITRECVDVWGEWGITRRGYYSNAHTIDHALFMDVPWWYAGYPGRNDGTYPGPITWALPRAPMLWQYTSTSGRLDVNVVVDVAMWDAWSVPATVPVPLPIEELEMAKILHAAETGGFYLHDGGVFHIGTEEGVYALRAAGYEVKEVNQHEIDVIAALYPAPTAGDEAAVRARIRAQVLASGYGTARTRERIAATI